MPKRAFMVWRAASNWAAVQLGSITVMAPVIPETKLGFAALGKSTLSRGLSYDMRTPTLTALQPSWRGNNMEF